MMVENLESARRMTLALCGGPVARHTQARLLRRFLLMLNDLESRHVADLDHGLGLCRELEVYSSGDCNILTSIRFLRNTGWVLVAVQARREWRKNLLREPPYYWDGSLWAPSYLPWW